MQPSIILTGLSARTPDGRDLFSDLNLIFGAERTGLVGRNGVGKTTLLRLILGEQAPQSGSIHRTGSIGVLRQVLRPPVDANLADLLGVSEGLARLRRLEAGEGGEDDLALADWTLEARLDAALTEIGLSGLDPERSATSLSGGEATRAALAGLLIQAPHMLLLDEPTNNLDRTARQIVGEVLERWRGGAIVVSHDRALLRPMDRIVELTSLGAQLYGGGFELYAERKAEAEAAATRALQGAMREADRIEREIQAARERQARRDRQGRLFAAKGSEPKIFLGAQAERAENSSGRGAHLADRRREDVQDALATARAGFEQARRLAFDLPSTGLAAGRTVLALDRVSFAWPGGEPQLRDVTLRLTGPERIAITGPNGSGKTTLLQIAAGELEPSEGTVGRAGGIAMLDQRTELLSDGGNLMQNFLRLNPAATPNDAHAALARFLFRNTAALKLAGALSGGERLRAALACVLVRAAPPQLLILDEPTNHLDLDSIAAVEAALSGYDGALLVVSHDEDFLEEIGIERRLEL